MIANVNDEQSVREGGHVLDAADGTVQGFDFTVEVESFLLRHLPKAAFSDGVFHFLEVLERVLHRLEVGEGAAEPTAIDVAHAGALGFSSDDLATAALRVDEQDLAALGSEVVRELLGFSELRNRLLEVDDMDVVAGAENVLSHLRVPETGLMAEVATSFKHFTHANHVDSPRFGLTSGSHACLHKRAPR